MIFGVAVGTRSWDYCSTLIIFRSKIPSFYIDLSPKILCSRAICASPIAEGADNNSDQAPHLMAHYRYRPITWRRHLSNICSISHRPRCSQIDGPYHQRGFESKSAFISILDGGFWWRQRILELARADLWMSRLCRGSPTK
jgi:hypothetical protein